MYELTKDWYSAGMVLESKQSIGAHCITRHWPATRGRVAPGQQQHEPVVGAAAERKQLLGRGRYQREPR